MNTLKGLGTKLLYTALIIVPPVTLCLCLCQAGQQNCASLNWYNLINYLFTYLLQRRTIEVYRLAVLVCTTDTSS